MGGRKKDKFKQPDVRVQRNAVTHKLETTVLDDVQRAFELAVNFIDGRMLKLGSNGDRHRLAAKLEERMRLMQVHTGGEGS